ncbi:MAG: hypothetical protein IJ737_00330 [Ruminococcus sp.]|nr:hypothetical protein [Ruminococcus sp.]
MSKTDNNFARLKLSAEQVELPVECEENDRAVRFLAAQTGVGHYDNINLLVLAVLMIFFSVCFLAVNDGEVNDDDKVVLSGETFLSGEYTAALEESYNTQLPVPEMIKTAQEHIALFYGVGNKLSDKPRRSSSSGETTRRSVFDEQDDRRSNDVKEKKVTTAASTDEHGNTVSTTKEDARGENGGTAAVTRPDSTTTTTTTTTAETTTTNNDPPEVTTTTTVPVSETTTTTTEEVTQPTEPTTEEPPDISDVSEEAPVEPPADE